MNRALPTLSVHRHGVFTTAEALHAGWTESALAHAVRCDRLVRVGYGCYVEAAEWQGDEPQDERRRLLLRTIAALANVATSVASHSSSALVADLPLWTTPPRACLTVAPLAGRSSSRRAKKVLTLLDPRSESPLESVSRLRLHETSLPRPELQTDILTLTGLLLGRVDFYWDEFGVVGEVDGLTKYREDPIGTTMRERRRQGLMDELGLIFVRWGRSDLRDMRTLTGRLEAAFARGSRRPRSDRGWIPRFAPQTYALAA